MKCLHNFIFSIFSGLAISVLASADVLDLEEQTDWVNLVGEFTTIGFTDYPDGTWISDQYSHLGVLFTDGADIVLCCSKQAFPWDGAGLDGNAYIQLEFDSPQRWIAVNYLGEVQIDLYQKGQLLSSSIFYGGGGSTAFFGGVISNELFNIALVYDPEDDQVTIDDLHFGFGLLGDINHDDVVGIEDLLFVISGYGPCPEPYYCPEDMDGNDHVNVEDLIILLNSWGPCHECNNSDFCPADIDENCTVNANDLLLLLSAFGFCPPADFIICPADVNFDSTVDISDIQLILDNWGEGL